MAYSISRVEVWAGDLVNKPGMLARVLEALAGAGANLEFVVARRVSNNTARVFVAPLKGARQTRAAQDVGLVRASGMHSLRIEGPDKPGLGAEITRKLADQGINLRGLSSAAIGRKSVCYIAFASTDDLATGQKALRKLLGGKR